MCAFDGCGFDDHHSDTASGLSQPVWEGGLYRPYGNGERADKYRIEFALRPYSPSDRSAVLRLLSILPSLYPEGDLWLDRRLQDVSRGRARCMIADTSRWGPAGLTIETPKGPRKVKLSTIFVDPCFRGYGIGSALLRCCRENWTREKLRNVYMTADLRSAGVMLPLVARFGFKLMTTGFNRYGRDRHEMVLSWLPDQK